MNFVSSLNRAIQSTQRAKDAVSLDVVSSQGAATSSGPAGGAVAPGSTSSGPGTLPAVIASPVLQIQNVPSPELVVIPPSNIFTEEYMKDFIGTQYTGANAPELNDLMEQLMDSPMDNSVEVNLLLTQIADIRGVDPETFAGQYQTFLNLSANSGGIGDIDLNRYPDFMGSNTHLRFGAIVGDTFGIDPVFGAMLSPTGGIVGPENGFWAPGENDAIGYHGIFHDAAGYMYNNHGVGPGYNYLGQEPFPTDFPGTGQISGLSFWLEQPGLDADFPDLNVPFTPDGVDNFANDVFDNGIDIVHDGIIIDGGIDQVQDGIGQVLTGDFGEGFGNISEGTGDALQGGWSLGGDLVDSHTIAVGGVIDVTTWGAGGIIDVTTWGAGGVIDVTTWGAGEAVDLGGDIVGGVSDLGGDIIGGIGGLLD